MTPLAGVVNTSDLAELAAAVEGNGEVWDAAEIPTLLADFLDRVPQHVRFEASPWRALKSFLKSIDRDGRFGIVWEAISRRGV